MSKDITIKVSEIIQGQKADLPSQGDMLYSELEQKYNLLDKNSNLDKLLIDFSSITSITSAFLNNSLGKLFYYYNISDVVGKIRFTGIQTKDNLDILKLTISNSIDLAKKRNNSRNQS